MIEMDDDIIELKPCPFCGTKPQLDIGAYSIADSIDDDRLTHVCYWTIGCNKCGCNIYKYSSLKGVVDAWNHRVKI